MMQEPCGNPLPHPRVPGRLRKVVVPPNIPSENLTRRFVGIFVPWLRHEYPGRLRYVQHVLGCGHATARALLRRAGDGRRQLTVEHARRLLVWGRAHIAQLSAVLSEIEDHIAEREASRRGRRPIWTGRYDRLQREKEAAARGEPEKPR